MFRIVIEGMMVEPGKKDYPKPSVTVDVAILSIREDGPALLLIERQNEPFAGLWALPGGFVDPEEPIRVAARRELAEETGLTVNELHIVDAFGDPGRDPRGWTISVAFYSIVSPQAQATSGDDARSAQWWPLKELPPLAFDHAKIVTAVLATMSRDLFALPILREHFRETFRLRELVGALEAVLGKALDRRSIRRRLQDARVIESMEGSRGRYRFRPDEGNQN